MTTSDTWALSAAVVVFVCALPGRSCADEERMAEADVLLDCRLKDLLWKHDLEEVDLCCVSKGLQSRDRRVQLSAIRMVVVHRPKNGLQLLADHEEDWDRTTRAVAQAVMRTLRTGGDVVSELVRLHERTPGDVSVDALPLIADVAVHAIAWHMRRGKAADYEIPAKLGSFHSELLRSSRLPRAEAIDRLVATLLSAKLVGAYESDVAQVLATYGEDGSDRVLEALSKWSDVSGPGPYAAMGLMLSQYRAVRIVTEARRPKFRGVLERLAGASEKKVARQAQSLLRVLA